ncbi:MAG: HNH endonuclease [Spirochaetaceae bacterium]|jgi:hypothetical protein|nr:HNH endonuclease [Spirochaetaceae bacterium]
MEINHEIAMKLWTERYGKGVNQAKDCKGRLMIKTAFGDEGSKYGWNIHHKKAKAKGGTDAKENLECVHYDTHDEIHGR